MSENTNKRILERGLPADIEAERIVLAAVLLRPSNLDDLTLTAGEFYQRRHGLIFETMLGLQAEGLPVEFPAILAKLADQGKLEEAGGATYIASLLDGFTASTPTYYEERVQSKALQRRLAAIGQSVEAYALDCENGADALEYAERQLFAVADAQSNGKRGESVTAGASAREFLHDLEETHGLQPIGIRTGLVDLDQILVALEPETLTLVGARPSNGKSAFGLTVALNAAQHYQTGVAFYSLEMTSASLTQRLLAMTGRLDLHDLRARSLGRNEWNRLTEAQAILDPLPLMIDDTRGLTAREVCSRARRLKQSNTNIGLVVVDYLTRLRFSRDRELRHELGDAVKLFKDLSGELGLPVIALSQLSRAPVAGGKVRRPQLSDLRESGNLEEDADNVLFVHREEMYDQKAEKGVAEVIVAKQRQGRAPEFVRVAFNGSCVRFDNLKTTAEERKLWYERN